VRGWNLISTILVVGGWVSTSFSATFAVIKSQNLSMLNEAITGFKVKCKGDYLDYDLEGNVEKAKMVFEEVKKKKPDVIITFGELASALGKKYIEDIPIVFSMVTDPKIYQLEGKNITGVTRVAPVEVILKSLKAIMPDVKKVGIIYNPKNTGKTVEEAMEFARAFNLQILAARVDSEKDAERAFKIFAASGGIDAFWLIPDPTVITQTFFKIIRDYTFANKLPLVAYSPEFVKAGALMALSPAYTTIGEQTCNTVLQILDGTSPSQIPVFYPKVFMLYFNLTVAKQLGFETIATNAVLYAGSQGYIINPIK